MHEIEVSINVSDVFDQLDTDDILKYLDYDEVIQAMDSDKFYDALSKSLLEHDPYEILDAIKHELDPEELRQMANDIEKSESE